MARASAVAEIESGSAWGKWVGEAVTWPKMPFNTTDEASDPHPTVECLDVWD